MNDLNEYLYCSLYRDLLLWLLFNRRPRRPPPASVEAEVEQWWRLRRAEAISSRSRELRWGRHKIHIGATETASRLGWVESPYYKQLLIGRVYKALDWTDAKSLSSTATYGMAFKFDALTDLEELQIRKLSDQPNDRVRIRFELQIGSVLNPSNSIWSRNRTTP